MDGNDTLIGGGGSDYLSGDAGVDVMTGGKGDDTYGVDDFGDTVNETAGEGTDTVETTLSHYQIGDTVENLTLTGEDDLAGYGNDGANIVTGNTGDNILAGLGGRDTLDGGGGADALYGGGGNDSYVVDNKNDTVFEIDLETGADTGGKDTVRASVSFALGDFVENLRLTGAADLNATGNALDNVITGNDGGNKLSGLDGADTITAGSGDDKIYGGAGQDTLRGNAGADSFVFNVGDTAASKAGADTIMDFHFQQNDLINLKSIDANEGKKGNQAFDFVGNDSFSHHAGELRFAKSGGDTYVLGDTDGDGKADFTVHLDGALNVKDDFFVL